MDRAELATQLAAADQAGRVELLAHHAPLADVELARALKALYLETNTSAPAQAAGAAAALVVLADLTEHPEARALAAWTAGMATQRIDGQMEQALALLDAAAKQFTLLGQPHTAAATQVSKVYALAILGRYDEAISCGLRARDTLLAHGDSLAAGKIEQNLGNIYHRRDNYPAAEQCYRAARERFIAVGDQKLLAVADNGLANVLALQHQFRAAEPLYEQALAGAAANRAEVTQAEIECNLGCLALFQGRYDRALDYLERSRRRYASLGMVHESAVAELELAEAYLELNLAPEAIAIYARVVPVFAGLRMRAEQARALAHHGRACLWLGQAAPARLLLDEAYTLYSDEGNAVGAAMVTLTRAQLHYAEGDYAAAGAGAAEAEAPLGAAGVWRQALLARWLRGEAARAAGQDREARAVLEAALRDARQQLVPQVAQRCATSLGLLAASTGDLAGAEEALMSAVALIEELRAPLPAEEFRTAFVADKLTPYVELARLCLADDRRVAAALDYVERMRSRALADMLSGTLPLRSRPDDPFEAELLDRLEKLREDLSWFYSQIDRPPDGARRPEQVASLRQAVRQREAEVLEITRQIRQRGAEAGSLAAPQYRAESLDIGQLQRSLDGHTALVEYFSLDDELLAFVVTGDRIEVVRRLGRVAQVEAALEQFHFQVSALRYGADRLRAHLGQLALRARHHLSALYDLLLRPIEGRIGARRLVIVPHRALHYVPFHALYDGASYLVERREICYAPSASVLHSCLARPPLQLQRALLLGVPDARSPRVRDEIAAIRPLFAQAHVLLDQEATRAALRTHAPSAQVLHLACHGSFRPDSPLFSALLLADGWLTVHDTYGMDLDCHLVVLSACETGLSAVAPGDELIGLARGFFSAGVPSLLVSLWTVHDETAAWLMERFYKRLHMGDGPAAALRHAQRELLADHPHPFFWSPFVLLGRW